MRKIVLTVLWGALALFLTSTVAMAASFYGTGADEFVYGTDEGDFLSAGPGDDEIQGFAGDDIIYAADAAGYEGFGSTDTIFCGDGEDFVIIDSSDLLGEDCEFYEYDLAVYTADTSAT